MDCRSQPEKEWDQLEDDRNSLGETSWWRQYRHREYSILVDGYERFTETLGTTPWKESYDQPRQHFQKQRHYFTNKGPSNLGYGFSSGHVWMWDLDCEESRALKNWCLWTVVLEKTLESPLDCKEIQPVHSKEDQPWVFFGRINVKAETPILWPPHVKSWLIGKDSDAGRDWGQE